MDSEDESEEGHVIELALRVPSDAPGLAESDDNVCRLGRPRIESDRNVADV